jgi:hypothetical protein
LPAGAAALVGAFLLACCLAVPPARAHDARVQAAPALATQLPESFQGVVEELVLDDRVNGRMLRFPRLLLSDGHSIALTGTVDDLVAGDRVTLDARRNGKSLDVVAVLRREPGGTPRAKGASVTSAGVLAIFHSDDFERGQAQFHYRLQREDGTDIALAIDALPAVLRGGMSVEVRGQPAGTAIVPARITILAMPSQPAKVDVRAKTALAHEVLVVMANFSNTAAPSFTAAQARQVMVSNATSVANFYDEASFGAHALNVTVTPTWVNLAGYNQPTCIDASLNTFTTAANAAATSAGYDPSGYEYVVYVFPSTPGCGWSGLGYIGFPKRAYVNGPGAFTTKVIAHEMGHNFGLLHAGSLGCGGATLASTCSVTEYGDPFSTMGNVHAGHFNAAQKSDLGWIPASSTPTHPGGSITYTLSPIENGGGATYAVKVPTPNSNRTYWIEFRQPIGFDAWSGWASNGAQVRLANPFDFYCTHCDGWSNDTELLDMQPQTSTFNDAALLSGSSYSDPDHPVTIAVLSATSSSLSIRVTTPVNAGASTTTLASSMNPAAAGGVVTFTATVTGTLPTGTVAFSDGAAAIAGCGAVALNGSGNSRMAVCSTGTLAPGNHGITASYGGDAGNAASASPTLNQTINGNGWLGYLYGGNTASGSDSAVAAGAGNQASGQASFVGAGTANQANGVSSLVLGGFDNRATAIDSFVGAGAGNRATGARSVIIGGGYNLASGSWSFIGGGGRDGAASTAAGTQALDHVAASKWSTIVGGSGNRAGTSASQTGSTVVGGQQNLATNTDATIAGGTANIASGTYAAVSGGQGNLASGSGAVAGGTSSTASALAAVAYGASSTASGSYAFAFGRRARSTASGAITLADATALDFSNGVANQLAVRATGGVQLVTGVDAGGSATAGVAIAPGSGSWSMLSDRNAKRDLVAVDAGSTLSRLLATPVYRWRYAAERSGARHMGPVAQDFHAAFGLGDSNRTIGLVDADGVVLASVAALQRAVDRRDAAIAARAQHIAALRQRIERLEQVHAEATALRRLLDALLAGNARMTQVHERSR